MFHENNTAITSNGIAYDTGAYLSVLDVLEYLVYGNVKVFVLVLD